MRKEFEMTEEELNELLEACHQKGRTTRADLRAICESFDGGHRTGGQ